MHAFEKHYADDLEQIELHGVTFHVKLPGPSNKRFQRAVLGLITQADEASGELVTRDVSLTEMADAQIEAWIATSIRRAEGWDDFTPERLAAMPDACEDLWERAVQLSRAEEAVAEDAVKKSEPTSPGPVSGPAERSSTSELSEAAG